MTKRTGVKKEITVYKVVVIVKNIPHSLTVDFDSQFHYAYHVGVKIVPLACYGKLFAFKSIKAAKAYAQRFPLCTYMGDPIRIYEAKTSSFMYARKQFKWVPSTTYEYIDFWKRGGYAAWCWNGNSLDNNGGHAFGKDGRMVWPVPVGTVLCPDLTLTEVVL